MFLRGGKTWIVIGQRTSLSPIRFPGYPGSHSLRPDIGSSGDISSTSLPCDEQRCTAVFKCLRVKWKHVAYQEKLSIPFFVLSLMRKCRQFFDQTAASAASTPVSLAAAGLEVASVWKITDSDANQCKPWDRLTFLLDVGKKNKRDSAAVQKKILAEFYSNQHVVHLGVGQKCTKTNIYLNLWKATTFLSWGKRCLSGL